jgi:hypothetical protein
MASKAGGLGRKRAAVLTFALPTFQVSLPSPSRVRRKTRPGGIEYSTGYFTDFYA